MNKLLSAAIDITLLIHRYHLSDTQKVLKRYHLTDTQISPY